MTTTLPINPRPWPLAADKVEGHWTQGHQHDGNRMCLVGGLQSCGLAPGEWLIARAVARHRDHAEGWNDDAGRTEADVVGWLRTAEPITPAELVDVFGPQWREVCAMVLRAARLTHDEASDLDAAMDATWDAAMDATWDAAMDATWDAARAAAMAAAMDATRDAARAAARTATRDAARAAARTAAWAAAWAAAWDATWGETWGEAWDAAWDATWDATRALVVRDLIGTHGFTQDHYDTLTRPWRTVIGPVHPDDAPLP